MEQLKQDIEFIKSIYKKLLMILPSFNITDEKILPYGLRVHTRSVSWLVEQVITQQTKFNKTKLGLAEVDFNMPDTCLHDCIIKTAEKEYFINIKVHNSGGRENKNDIAAVEKLYMQYSCNPVYNVIYVCMGIYFENIKITFDADYIAVFTAQFLPIYVNPRNDKIQAFYKHNPQYRSRREFLKILKENSKSINLE
ncbi:MAG: hypothetical protein LBH29_05300 [Elusimicrobiota bacterium]|jgi:hypothetical protein|nr:hypothetical protein [Elusimicrobiota bacterium]